MSGFGPLTNRGKPMTVLRVLAQATKPLDEQEVYTGIHGTNSGGPVRYYHDALRTLVVRGYAERTGSRGGYHHEITDKGRLYLERS